MRAFDLGIGVEIHCMLDTELEMPDRTELFYLILQCQIDIDSFTKNSLLLSI